MAFGLIPSNFTDSTGTVMHISPLYTIIDTVNPMPGDTLGGIGSAIAIKRGSFVSNSNGTFAGTFITQPDRGFNV